MSIFTFLIALVGPVMARWFAAMGLSLIALTGAEVALQAMKDGVATNIGGMPGASVQLCGLFGIWGALGIIFGAMTFCITWRASKGFWSIAKA